MKLLFATNNKHKLKEVKSLILNDVIEIVGLEELEISCDIPETESTIEGNAKQKVDFIQEHFKIDCFADDTGLIVDSLNGAPGVHSARYAGPNASSEENITKLLNQLESLKDRSAYFKTCIALNLNDNHYMFTGVCKGNIIKEPKGLYGFGYDPVFIPDGFDKTFSEMSLNEKNAIGHRGKAITKFVHFLMSINR